MMVALQLARQGWWGGDPDRVLEAPSETVLAAAQYEKFRADYERTYIEMNREKR